jgi:hydroxyethylthiazole kinase-like uncharacterized protein yjeF
VIDAREARRLDLNSAELGVPLSQLMRNAGKALAGEVAKEASKGDEVLLFCGKGNNGGDGIAAAIELKGLGRKPWVILAEPRDRLSPLVLGLLAKVKPRQVTTWEGRPQAGWDEAKVVVDCLLGSGIVGRPRPPYPALISYINSRARSGATVIACDLPSGLGTPSSVKPAKTVTFHDRKEGMDSRNAGKVVVADIGIPPKAQEIGFGDLVEGYRFPEHASHKGDNGTVLVVAGSLPFVGAPQYVAWGAYRTGADLVHIAAPQSAADVLRTAGPEAIVHTTNPGDTLNASGVPIATRLMRKVKAMVIGPGLGASSVTRHACAELLQAAAKARLPTVVDADALDALSPRLLRAHGKRMVLTPHAREFRDLAGVKATDENVIRYARRSGATVLRKGAVDVVTDGRRSRHCSRGHPTMTVGGTGDTLAGIVATLLAKGAPPFEAACAASYLSKSAGEIAASFRSYGATARDVADAIPSILLRLEEHGRLRLQEHSRRALAAKET